MNEIIEKFLSTVTNLSMLEPKRLPCDVLQTLATMESEELFKMCTQLFILKNNIPTKKRLITLEEDEIVKGAISYMEDILRVLKDKKDA